MSDTVDVRALQGLVEEALAATHRLHDGLRPRLASLETRFTAMEGRFSAMEERIAGIERSQDYLSRSVSRLEQLVLEVLGKLP
jgi:hypothetical protein